MIRLTWLQFRAQGTAALGALLIVAIALAVTGPHLHHLYGTSGLGACQAHGSCGALAVGFLNQLAADQILYFTGIGLLLALPAVIGMFWGAPLVAREFETGSCRVSWTQSVTRTRWLAVKLGVLGLASMATAGLLSLMLTWWSAPIDTASALKTHDSITFIRIGFLLFPARGVVPVGYAAFAFALGVTAGVWIRRTVPAMAATLAAFAVVAIAWPLWAQANLIAPAHAVVPLTPARVAYLAQGPGNTEIAMPPASSTPPGSWVVSVRTIDPAGRAFNVASIPACRGSATPSCAAILGRTHLRDLVRYQPASRFWPLQWYELAIFLGVAAVLAGVCLWRVRRSVA